MLNRYAVSLYCSFILCLSSYAAPDSVSLDTINDYHGWGWEVLVVSNNYITIGIVPAIGGRVLQYDLDTDTFMIINESLFGQLFYDESSSPWNGNWGYGGYKTWPAPQSVWNWPPPPTLAWGNYEYEVTHASNDSVVIWLRGQTETIRAPGLRFDRYIAVYRNSSRVKVTTVLFNDDDQEQNWSIWDVTQTIVQHETDNDFVNYSVYFPAAGPSDVWGSGPYYDEVLPGIYQAKYVSDEGKISSSTSEGWVCYTDERDEQTYAKIFDLVEGAEYTHNGASVEIYTNGSIEYMEVEVLGPYESIGPNSDSIIFIEDWYATRVSGPLYSANRAGLVKEQLEYNRQTKTLSGVFGVFNEGELQIKYFDSDSMEIGTGPVLNVSPFVVADMAETDDLPASTQTIELQAYNVDGLYIDCIDRIDISADDSFISYKALEAPVIDGIADDNCWDEADWYPINFVWLPYNDYVASDDFTGRFKLSWTEDRLLILVETVDDSLFDGHIDPLQNYWDDDCVEVFLDEDHSGGNHLYNFNAFAYHVSTIFDVVDNDQSDPALFNSHIDAALSQFDSMYTWELSIKVFDDTYVDESSIPVILTHEKEMGFSLAYCDNDGSASRENFIGSKYLPENESNNSYIDASLFGTLTLIDPSWQPDLSEPVTFRETKDVLLYPNPAVDRIYYWFNRKPENEIAYQIVNMTGQIVRDGKTIRNAQGGVIDLSSIGKGIYSINFYTIEGIYSERIILL